MAKRRRQVLGVLLTAVAFAAAVSVSRGSMTSPGSRNAGVEQALQRRGLDVDRDGVLWLEQPPYGVLGSLGKSVPVVVRAAPGPDEPHDIYLVAAKLSPEGVLLSLGRAHNLTETSAVDEQRPVGGGGVFAFVEQSMLSDEHPNRVRLIDLAAPASADAAQWTRAERVKATITRLQKTGRTEAVSRVAYSVEPAPEKLSVSILDGRLHVRADDRLADIALSDPLAVPDWLGCKATAESRPGDLVPWAVDRVRAEIGDEAMQYIKAIAFSALDALKSRTEELSGDTGEDGIAEDLGQESLEGATRTAPVDPEIGFPPPPLEPWVTPTLPGEGVWHPKDEDPFIHTLPGLPPTFVTTFIRGDRRRKVTRVYIALWDPRLVQLNMMAGLAEPKSATGATGPGFIPREPTVLKRVAAAMNSGFQALHGEYGMMSDGVIYLPPKPYGATVTLGRDGSIGFGTWPPDTHIPEDMASYRQNMTPMVLDGKFNPYGRTWWGGTPADWEDRTHTVRTGICLTKERFVGYFYGAELSPKALAQAMIQARCSYGIALDMNAGHSGLEFYKVAPEAQFAPLERPLRRDWEREGNVRDMDGWKFRARRLIRGMGLMYFPRYIGREGRDFFYLTLRYVLPGNPLAPLDTAQSTEGDGAWQVKGLPQHGFPYVLALTQAALPSGKRARVLKMDPRMVSAVSSADAGASGDGALVAVISPTAAAGAGTTSLWWSRHAFLVAEKPAAAGSVRIATGVAASAGGTTAA
ncbi:MAG: hypothetical protein JRI68_22060, partial [Deltaproteobacteria bacterium]|nr:hypothetical protein [Deltaproteobacteria bacterium]